MYDILKEKNTSSVYYSNMTSDICVMIQASQIDTPEHSHNFLEFCYILSGEIMHTIGGVTSILKNDDFFIIDIDTPHKFTKLQNSECQLINIMFRPSVIDHTLSDKSNIREVFASPKIGFYSKDDCSFVNGTYHDSSNIIKSLALDMKKEFAEMQFGYEQKLKCSLISILIHTVRRFYPNLSSEASGMHEIISYINQHYNEHLTLEKLGAKFNMNPSYLCTKLKKSMGYSFIQYLQKIRIANACRLLSLTDMRISEICTAVGYDDIKHFEKIFRKHTTDNPLSYRKISKELLSREQNHPSEYEFLSKQ